MENLSLQKLAQALGSDCTSNVTINDICIDTRKIKKGCLFVAIKGERFDGHDFIEQAFKKGAAGVVSERPVSGYDNVILVKDTGAALLDIAWYYRKLFRVFVVGVTGSVGKTSTKEMIATILSVNGKTLKTEGNLNNQIGMPLTMFRLDSTYQAAVVEMGMSDFGEISTMTKASMPNVGVITNIGVSHMETLGSRENILKVKLEITDGMVHDAPLVLNGDDDLLRSVSNLTDRPIIYYGIDKDADITASDIITKDGGTNFIINYYGQSIEAWIPIIGRHNVYNALAGFCVGMVADIEPEKIVWAMRFYKSAGMRQNVKVKNSITIISDCYNASPDSMKAAIDVITSVECSGRRICVFGDMLELGSISEKSHIEVGREVARSAVDMLFCYGELSKNIKKGAESAGMRNVWYFNNKQELAGYLIKTLQSGDCIIYKASRGVMMEDVMKLVEEGMKV